MVTAASPDVYSPAAVGERTSYAIALWLLGCCALIFAMVVLGGVTRLTGSGLSMVDWQPIMGVLPPLTAADWQAVFERYREFPEYQFVNRGMSLEEFKTIFWFEYWHRVLGRLIGIAFLIPFVYFALRRRIERRLYPKLATMFVLGGLQGLLGWYMVKSGLVDDPHASQYRLTAHLALAFAIYGYMLWTALGLLGAAATEFVPAGVRRFAMATLVVVGAMIVSGGFVAGTRAGFIMNTFPDMQGEWLPGGLFALEPLWRNFFENAVSIQFWHRVGALTAAIAVVTLWLMVTATLTGRRARRAVNLLAAAVALQITLGIATLLSKVPVVLGAAHQGGALLLLTAALFALRALYPASRP